MATKERIAVIKGVFAKPGMSKNRRIYSPQAIKNAVTEAQGAIDSGETLNILTHHTARDAASGDVSHTAGRITKVGLSPEGWGTFEADVADTASGRDIANLTTTKKPYVKGVSMASLWKSDPYQVRGPDGQPATTADEGFSLKGIDFTHNSGIVGAEITSAELAESAAGELIFEDIEEDIFVERVDGDTPAAVTEAATIFADPGYNGEKALPITTPAEIRTTWVQLHRKAIIEGYTPKQVGRMRGKVQGQAQKAGFDIVGETRAFGTEIIEAYTSISVDNGPADLRVSAYVDDPSKLQAVTQKVAVAAMAALYSLDPDNDGDIDLGGGATDDDVMPCPFCSADCPAGALFCPTCGQAIPPAESAPTEKEPIMGTETQDKGAVTESTLTLTQAQLDETIAAGVKTALEAAGIKPDEHANESAEEKVIREAAEHDAKVLEEAEAIKAKAAPPSTFTLEQVKAMITESNAEVAKTVTEAVLDVARKEIQEAGPRRRGLVSKSILEQSPEDLYGADADLTKLDLQDLEKLTEKVAYPLIAS